MAESKQKMEAISAKDTGVLTAPQAESDKGDEKSKKDQPILVLAHIPTDWQKQLEALALKYKEEILSARSKECSDEISYVIDGISMQFLTILHKIFVDTCEDLENRMECYTCFPGPTRPPEVITYLRRTYEACEKVLVPSASFNASCPP